MGIEEESSINEYTESDDDLEYVSQYVYYMGLILLLKPF